MMHFDVIPPESRHESSRQFNDPFDETEEAPIDELEEIPTGELGEISAGNSGSALHPVYLLVYSSLTKPGSASG